MNQPVSRKTASLLRRLHSGLEEVDAFCREVRDLLMELDLAAEVFPVELLLRESLNNAIIHGNGGDGRKMVQAEIRIRRNGIVLRVEDEGNGFNRAKEGKGPPDPEKTCGRGLAIYHLYADRVSFNRKGNRVSFWRAVTGGEKS